MKSSNVYPALALALMPSSSRAPDRYVLTALAAGVILELMLSR